MQKRQEVLRRSRRLRGKNLTNQEHGLAQTKSGVKKVSLDNLKIVFPDNHVATLRGSHLNHQITTVMTIISRSETLGKSGTYDIRKMRSRFQNGNVTDSDYHRTLRLWVASANIGRGKQLCIESICGQGQRCTFPVQLAKKITELVARNGREWSWPSIRFRN